MAGSTLLPTIEITEPCSNSWDSMSGDDRVRHCTECNLNVYNSLGLSTDELSSLVTEREGRLCMRLYRRPDGSVVTRDCHEARAIGLRREFAQLCSELSLHHLAHACFILVFVSFLGPLGALLWLALVLVCRYREWVPQVVELLRSSDDRGGGAEQGQSRIAAVVRLQPLRFLCSTWVVVGTILAPVIAMSLFVESMRTLYSLAHIVLDGSMADLFSPREVELGGF